MAVTNEKNGNKETALDHVIGRPLSAVIFVMDYIQLQFDSNHVLSIIADPSIEADGILSTPASPDFRNVLCERIGRNLESAKVDSNLMQLIFDDGSIIRVSLDPWKVHGGEAVNLHISAPDYRFETWP